MRLPASFPVVMAATLLATNCLFVNDACSCSDPVPWTVVYGQITSPSGPQDRVTVSVVPELYHGPDSIFDIVHTAGDGSYRIPLVDIAGDLPYILRVRPDPVLGYAPEDVVFTPPFALGAAVDSVRINVELQAAPPASQ